MIVYRALLRGAFATTAAVLLALGGCEETRKSPTGPGSGSRADSGPRGDSAVSDSAVSDSALADSTVGDSGSPDAASDRDSGASDTGIAQVIVPDPGPARDGEFRDVEPNDTPDRAVPVGLLTTPVWMGFASPMTTIGSNLDIDYFVFKTGAENTLRNVTILACWDRSLGNLLDMTLFNVTNGRVGTTVVRSESTDTSCETGVDSTLLSANTTYLLEIKAGPGLSLPQNTTGAYSA